ncbi:DUF58 domain-containing protein [Planctomycetota bacterium]
MPSRLAFTAYLAVSALLVLGPLLPAIGTIVLLLDAAITVLVLFEGFYVLRDGFVEVKRSFSKRLSLAEDNLIELQVSSRVSMNLELRIRDIIPDEFDYESDEFGPVFLQPMAEELISYQVRPRRRGRWFFGDIYVRIGRRGGWAVRRFCLAQRQEARVYPNLVELQRYETLRQSRRLMNYGLHAMRKFGKGSEFESLRDYQNNDDYKDINWKATARLGRPITQLYQIERSQNVMIVIDSGRMMSTQAGDLTKFDYAVNAALMLAYVAKRTDDKVGLMLFSDRVKTFVPVGSGSKQLAKIIESLYPVQPDGFFVDYKAMARFLKLKNRKRGLVVIFTDFPDADSGRQLLQNLRQLRRSHLVLCIAVSDENLVRLRQSHPANSREAYEKVVALELLEEREEILLALSRMGVQVLDLPSQALTIATLNKYIELKSRALF